MMKTALTIPHQQELFPQPPPENRSAVSGTFGDNMRMPIHRWFRYSAGFSAEWVQAEVRKREDQTLKVFDPFAGSGTTLIAAQQAGAESMGTDSHPFVSRVALAKLCWTADPSILVDRAEKVIERFVPVQLETNPDLLTKCFRPDALSGLLGIRDSIRDINCGDDIDRLLWMALVSIIRPCSHVGTAQWQYVLPNKTKSRTVEPLEGYVAQISAMAADMRTVQDQLPTAPPAVFLASDARSCAGVPDQWADLVLTSPPYANNYDYADAARLEMTLLGEVVSWGDLKKVRQPLMRSCSQHMTGYVPEEALSDPILAPIENELREAFCRLDEERGSHGGKKAYHHMAAAYFHDLAHVWQSLRRVVVDGGEVCFVVGDSAPYGVHLPVERWLGDLAVSQGFRSWRFEQLRTRNDKWKNRKHRVPLKEGRLWVQG